MANNQFVYKPTYQINPFNPQYVLENEKNVDPKTQKIRNQQNQKKMQEAVRANYYKDLNNFITQGRDANNVSRLYREDEDPFVLRQFDMQLPKNQFYSNVNKKIKKRKQIKSNKYFN